LCVIAESRRKSNVVKEIEKIKKNREQRRANQEEKRQKLNEVDTSVPAWEFANMIRFLLFFLFITFKLIK
jgi:kinesin family protein 2/24